MPRYPCRALDHLGQLAFGGAANDLDPGTRRDPGLERHTDECDHDATMILDREIGDLTRVIAVIDQSVCESSPDAIQLGCHE
jgi:hypothetical protein